MDNEVAWEAYSSNKAVLKALHECCCASMDESGDDGMVTPPATPVKGNRKERAQRSGGA